MNPIQYFQSYKDYFWQWEEEGDVLAIPGGNTIAYHDFVIQVLQQLAPQGIPPFGSLLLAILATNLSNHLNHSPDDAALLQMVRKEGKITAIKTYKETTGLGLKESKEYVDNLTVGPDLRVVEEVMRVSLRSYAVQIEEQTLIQAIDFLQMLCMLPPAYKEGNRRMVLFQTLFENCHNIVSVKNSGAILRYAPQIKLSVSQRTHTEFQPSVSFLKDFRTISLLSSKFPTVESILEKLAQVPEVKEDIRLEPARLSENTPKDFIQALIDTPKTFYVGSLIRRIWSGLSIPLHHALPSQQPLGGVSDLTNKGDFDRLLISEFANDDLIFLSRLANQEALYIRREVPPESHDLKRVFLIDASIKNWGTPKTLAFAVAIAIARHPKTNISCSAFAVGESYYPLSLDTIDGVIEGVQQLEGCLHPASGLESFLKESAYSKKTEIFFISTLATLRLAPVQKVLSDYADRIHYQLQTDATGSIALYKKQNNSYKHLQTLQLPLTDLWTREPVLKPVLPLGVPAPHDSIYPILFPGALTTKRIVSAPDGRVFKITTEKTLLRLYEAAASTKKGWELIYDHLPFAGDELEVGLLDNGEYILLLFKQQTREILLFNITTRQTSQLSFSEWQSSFYKHFIFYKNNFYYLTYGRYWVIDPQQNSISRNDKTPAYLIEEYKEREEELKKLPLQVSKVRLSTIPGILKNINKIFINGANTLVFNIHALHLNPHGSIKLEKTEMLTPKLEAVASAQGKFTFAEGSTISVLRSGMLVLQSSNTSLPTIYIPSVVEGSLGIATESEFAGNEYYYLPQTEKGDIQAIKSHVFWQRYVSPFIAIILKHGTKN